MEYQTDLDGDMITAQGLLRAIKLSLTTKQQGMLAGLLLDHLQAESARCMRRLVASSEGLPRPYDTVACTEPASV